MESDTRKAEVAIGSPLKLVFFDASLALDAHIDADVDAVVRHQKAIQELSTPIVRVFDRVLLLPLVGAIDSARAEQILQTVLEQVHRENARVIIVDISGLLVVDTRVASHLVKFAEMVRLLGAETVFTGIAAAVARCIVRLGVDESLLRTSASLEQGIAHALGLVDRVIADTHPVARSNAAR